MIAKSEAAREVDAFGKRWGMPHLDLAKHAAFPLAIAPDLVYRLWATFRTDVTGRPLDVAWIAVADLLLSPLCSEVGHELFEMRPAIQRELLSRLQNDARFGHRRFAELAAFVASYYANQLRSYHIGDREFAEDQRWFARKIAIAYVDPSGAVNELANEDPDDPRKLRVIGIASRLPPGVLQASARAASPKSPTAPSAAPPEGAGERGQFLPLNFAQSEALTEELRKPIEETISKYRRYLKGIGYHSEQDQVTVLIDPSLHDNAYYLPKLNQIVMAREFALDPDAILREYTHHVLSYTKRDTDEPPWTSIASGLADYLPCSFNNKPTFAEKVALLFSHTSSHGYVRNLENIRRFDELKPGALQQDAGEVWGGAFWALRTRLGSEFIDPILFSAWSSWEIAQDSPESFVGFARSLVSAAASASAPQGETAESEVRATFERRGLSLALGGQTSHPDVGGDHESGVETDEALGDHIRVGDVLSAHGRLDDALSAYRAGLAVAERLAAADPSNTGWQRDLSVSQGKLGDVLSAQGRLDDALSAYRAGLAIRERLAAADPSNAGWQRDLSVSQNKVGDVLSAQGRLDDALSAYRAGLAIAERLAAADPSNAGWQRDLFISYEKLGLVEERKQNPKDAAPYYAEAAKIIRQLAPRDPSNAQWQRDLARIEERLATVSVPSASDDQQKSGRRSGLWSWLKR
jgi:tetratricopeptide (TPR) repeat protein